MPKAKVLFVCVENAGRSQMAEGFARRFGAEHIDAASAGSRPSGKVNPVAVEAMAERGIDLSGQSSKGLSDVPSAGWDYVVTMGCGDACPFVPAKSRLDWRIPDPKGQSPETVRGIRQQIEDEVLLLIRRVIAEGFGAE